jgi:hypothetical protein
MESHLPSADSRETAYKLLQKHYGWWMMLPHERFQRIIDPHNQVMILLHSHWIALKQMMAFITQAEQNVYKKNPEHLPAGTTSTGGGGSGGPRSGGSGGSGGGDMDIGILRWLKHLNGLVDDEHLIHNQWPIWVVEQLDRDPFFFGRAACDYI